MAISARLDRASFDGPFAEYRRFTEERMERAALIAVQRGGIKAKARLRQDGQAAGLGRLMNAIGDKPDEQIHRRSNGFSASSAIFIRSRSERTRGAIESYTVGADIRPVRSRWLWLSTDSIPRLTGRFRMTPELYVRNGFEQKIGPLVRVRAANGNPLLIVRNVGVGALGQKRSAKSLTKRGRVRKGQVAQEFIVAFIGIPRTARAARIDVTAIMREAAAGLPALFNEALGRI